MKLTLIRRSAHALGPCVLVFATMACGRDAISPEPPPPPPPDTPAVTRYIEISAGGDHSCALDERGRAFCWGLGTSGRLGNGRLDSLAFRPQSVVGGNLYFSISAGLAHTCAAAAGGQLYCWGRANNGQVANNSADPQSRPFRAFQGAVETFVAVTAGSLHSCGIGGDLEAYCWGWNAHGQLGINSTIDQGGPARVAGGNQFATLSAGRTHTCGVTTNRRILCFGQGTSGQLGDGGSQSRFVPTAIGSTESFTIVSAGGNHTCALTIDGRAFCWGSGEAGQLGTGDFNSADRPVAVMGTARFVHISAGDEHTCAVTMDGQATCWGHNNHGRLGRETLPAPQPVPAGIESELRFARITAGRLHTCALTAAGAAYCWGFGGFGQLGNGFAVSQTKPVRISEPGDTIS